MKGIARWGLAGIVVALSTGGSLAPAAEARAARVFAAPVDRVWSVTESVLKSLDWDIDTRDRTIGSIVTDSRGVDFKEFGVYGEGTRHKLRLTLTSTGANLTSVTIERELYKEERILWIKEKKPLTAQDNRVEVGVLDAIARQVAVATPAPSAPVAPSAPPTRPAPSAPPAVPPAAPSPPAAPTATKPQKVTYRVTGTAGEVLITYRTPQGATERKTAPPPWEVSFTVKSGDALYVSAVSTPGQAAAGSVTCEVLVDGVTRTQSTSVGASAVATCSATADRR